VDSIDELIPILVKDDFIEVDNDTVYITKKAMADFSDMFDDLSKTAQAHITASVNNRCMNRLKEYSNKTKEDSSNSTSDIAETLDPPKPSSPIIVDSDSDADSDLDDVTSNPSKLMETFSEHFSFE